MATYFEKGDENILIHQLIKAKRNFVVTRTLETCKVKIDEDRVTYYYSDEDYTFKVLNLMKAVKNDVQNQIGKHLNEHRSKEDVKYYDWKQSDLNRLLKLNELTYENVVEVDISQAYFITAVQFGYLSTEMHEKLKEVEKNVRLRVLGSIATSKKNTPYLEGVPQKMFIDENPLLRGAWWNICAKVDRTMIAAKLAVEKDFLFYWVDGIYFRKSKKNIAAVTRVLNENGYSNIKIKEIDEVKFKLSKASVNITTSIFCAPETKEKTFNIPTGKVKGLFVFLPEINI